MSGSGTVVILANGAPPVAELPLRILRNTDQLVCCDGAYAKARALGREPDFVVGDGDSLSSDEKAALGSRFVPIADQDTNDLAKALRFVLGMEGRAGSVPPPARIVILGATGLREDHTLGNVFHLFDFAALLRERETKPPILEMVTDTGTFEVVSAVKTFACQPGDAVSIFACDPDTRVHSEGLAWPLDGVMFPNLWCATLNRTTGATFLLNPDRPILVFRVA